MHRNPPSHLKVIKDTDLNEVDSYLPNSRGTKSVPTSPNSFTVNFAPSIMNLVTHEKEKMRSSSLTSFKTTVIDKVSKWSLKVKNTGSIKHSNNSLDNLDLKHGLKSSSLFNKKCVGRRVSISGSDGLGGDLRSKAKNKSKDDEEVISWIEMIRPSRSSWDSGLQVKTLADGTQNVECYYGDKASRQKLKNMISTSDFDDILRDGYTGSGGTRLETIRVTLTPNNAKFDNI